MPLYNGGGGSDGVHNRIPSLACSFGEVGILR